MKVFRSIITGLMFLFTIQGCAQQNPDEYISMDELRKRINSADTSMVIVDVRTDSEVTGPLTKIDGALHIPIQEITERIDELEMYKDKELVVICRTQNRSSSASEFLRKNGYNSKYVPGGMQEYYKNK